MDHFYNLPNMGEDWFTYLRLYKEMVSRFPTGSTFVELGAYKGKSISFLTVEVINSKKDINIFCVDSWDNKVFSDAGWGEGLGDAAYNTFIKNIEPVKDKINYIKSVSWKASEQFEDKSVDFVFVDASHDYEDVVKDLEMWIPKIKDGGVLAGHDYFHKPIRDAVRYVIGDGNYGDPWHCQCFITQKKEGRIIPY